MCVKARYSKAGIGKLQPAACFVNRVTLEYSLVHSVMDCMCILLYVHTVYMYYISVYVVFSLQQQS